jgi:hypothetical protein
VRSRGAASAGGVLLSDLPAVDDAALWLQVRGGELVAAGSWVYVWLRPDADRRVVYVGGTGLPPAARTWLHLHSPDPEVGRIAARYAEFAAEPLDVLAWELDSSLLRPTVRAAVITRLAAEGLLSERYVGIWPDAAEHAADVAAVADRVAVAVARYREQAAS